MKYVKWPLDPQNDCPAQSILFCDLSIEHAETLLVDCLGFYRLVPAVVVQNAIGAIKKAEQPKSLMPLVVLRFDQTVGISYTAAKILLQECSNYHEEDAHN